MDKGTQKTLIRESPPLSFPVYDKSIQFCYVIHKNWWQDWTRHVGFYSEEEGPDPGDLDNSKVILRKSFQSDLVCLRKVAWKRLKGWYNGRPSLKVFIVNGWPKWKSFELKVILPDNRKVQVKVSLKISLSVFQDFICKKFRLAGPVEIMTHSEASMTKHYASDYSLKTLGFDDVTFVKFSSVSRVSSQVITEFENLNIEDSDDEELQKAIKVSMNETLPKGENFEMNDMGRGDRVKDVKKIVEDFFMGKKTQLKVFSLRRIERNVGRILSEFK